MKRRIAAAVLAMLSACVLSVPASALSTAPGTHEQWTERILVEEEWPQETKEYAQWLEQQAELGAEGALADVTLAEYFSEYGVYGYCLGVITSKEPVRFSATGNRQKDQKAAYQAIQEYMASSGLSEQIRDISDYAMAALQALDRDHPEIFWLSGTPGILLPVSYSYSSDGEANFTQTVLLTLKSKDLDIRQKEYRDPDKIRTDAEKLEKAVQTILTDVPQGTRTQQLAFLYDWLTQHNSYNTGASQPLRAHHSLSALLGSVGEDGPVCEGYARALKVLCDRLEIPCVLVSGEARAAAGDEAQLHMWNLVQLEDGRWYGADVTWDDPLLYDAAGALVTKAVSGAESRRYFLVSADTEAEGLRFDRSHVPQNRVSVGGLEYKNGPELAPDAYSEKVMSVTVFGETEEYSSAAAAFAAAKGKTAHIRLLRNANTAGIRLENGTKIVLDLNGFTLDGNVGEDGYLFFVDSGAELTLRDSSEDRSGALLTDGKVLAVKGGTVYLEFFG